MGNSPPDIATRFMKCLEYLGMSGYKASKEFGVSETSIANIKSGKNNPKIELVQKLLNKYDVLSADWLILGTGKMIRSEKIGKLKMNTSKSTGKKLPGNLDEVQTLSADQKNFLLLSHTLSLGELKVEMAELRKIVEELSNSLN